MRQLHILISLVLSALLLYSCEETVPSLEPAIPSLEPVEIENNGGLAFTLKGTASNAAQISDCGFYISYNVSMRDATKYSSKLTGNSFAAEVTLKGYGCYYYVCSYISNGRTEILSDTKTISIAPLEDYVDFGTVSVNSYNRTTGKTSFSTTCSAAEGVEVTKYGILWGTSENLKTSGTPKELTFQADGKAFTFDLPDLELGTQYYVCQYLTDTDATAYGNTEKFKVYSFPIVELGEISNITSSSATVTGSVPDKGGALLQEKGIVYVEGDAIPTVETGKVISYDVSSDFSALLSGLSPNKEYSVRAYAKNSEGTSYSSERKKFKTLVGSPDVYTGSATSITSNSAVLNATLFFDGSETPSECGFLWSETSFTDPSTATQVVSSLSGASFSTTLSSLTRATTYYYQAYAVNSAGISYGDIRSLTTKAELPTVTTAAVSDVTENSATCGGTVTDDGGADVTKRGVVWSTSPNPTVSLSTKTVDGSGTGDFSSTITGLSTDTDYYVRAYATNSVGTSYGEQRTFTTKEVDFSSAQDLSSSKTANCYIVSSAGKYKFKTVKGNSTTSVGNVSSCEVLWETFGTSTAPVPGDLIYYSVYKDDYICFISNSFFREGNAVIAAKDASGNILWSWHIWLTDTPQGQEYNNNAGVMMDRNLGATSATPGDVGALGLLYQWGRKDPFLGSSSIRSDTVAESTISWPSSVSSSSSTGSISYALAHPTTFITYNSSKGDWYYTGDSSTDNTRWQSSKTIYDPCPAGWRVPDGGSGGVWATASGTSNYWTTSSNWNSTYMGMDFSKTDKKLGSSGPIWYPASGYRNGRSGDLSSVGYCGYYWSASPNGKGAYFLNFNSNGYVGPADDNFRAYGQSIRCLQE